MKWGHSINCFISSNKLTQLQGIEGSCKRLNLNKNLTGLWPIARLLPPCECSQLVCPYYTVGEDSIKVCVLFADESCSGVTSGTYIDDALIVADEQVAEDAGFVEVAQTDHVLHPVDGGWVHGLDVGGILGGNPVFLCERGKKQE